MLCSQDLFSSLIQTKVRSGQIAPFKTNRVYVEFKTKIDLREKRNHTLVTEVESQGRGIRGGKLEKNTN